MCSICHRPNLTLEDIAAMMGNINMTFTKEQRDHLDDVVAKLLGMELKDEDSELAEAWEKSKSR